MFMVIDSKTATEKWRALVRTQHLNCLFLVLRNGNPNGPKMRSENVTWCWRQKKKMRSSHKSTSDTNISPNKPCYLPKQSFPLLKRCLKMLSQLHQCFFTSLNQIIYLRICFTEPTCGEGWTRHYSIWILFPGGWVSSFLMCFVYRRFSSYQLNI